jgi:hypothetical protein
VPENNRAGIKNRPPPPAMESINPANRETDIKNPKVKSSIKFSSV